MTRNKAVFWPLLAALVLAAAPASAQLECDWYSVDGGGAMWMTDSSDQFELSGTIGQPDCSATVMSADDFELTGGFWAVPVVQTPCSGDVNGDRIVDLLDLTILLSAFGSTSGDPAFNSDADLDSSGAIDLTDLTILLSNFGTTCR